MKAVQSSIHVQAVAINGIPTTKMRLSYVGELLRTSHNDKQSTKSDALGYKTSHLMRLKGTKGTLRQS